MKEPIYPYVPISMRLGASVFRSKSLSPLHMLRIGPITAYFANDVLVLLKHIDGEEYALDSDMVLQYFPGEIFSNKMGMNQIKFHFLRMIAAYGHDVVMPFIDRSLMGDDDAR